MEASRPRSSPGARIHKRRGACMRRWSPAVSSLLLACKHPRGSTGPPPRPCAETLPFNSARRYDRSVAGSLIFGAFAVLAFFLLLRVLHLLGFLGYCISRGNRRGCRWQLQSGASPDPSFLLAVVEAGATGRVDAQAVRRRSWLIRGIRRGSNSSSLMHSRLVHRVKLASRSWAAADRWDPQGFE